MTDKWDQRFLALAEHVAGWSKDPSTHTGAVIADESRRLVSVGFNGFPRHVADLEERLADRATRLRMTVHAEVNAVVFAGRPLPGCTAYVWPWPPCGPCAATLIQAGIGRVVAPTPTEQMRTRWGSDFDAAEAMFREAGVELVLV